MSNHIDSKTGIAMATCGIKCVHNQHKMPLYTVYLLKPLERNLTKDEAQHLIQNYRGQQPYELEVRQSGFQPNTKQGKGTP